jgi:hypothetical protein
VDHRKEYFRIHLLREDSIRRLYCQRLDQYLDNRTISLDINTEWEDLKETIVKAASEVLGKRYMRTLKKGLENLK